MKIGFDYDGTIEFHNSITKLIGNGREVENNSDLIKEIARFCVQNGHDVHIVTRRSLEKILIEEVLQTASELGIRRENCHFLNHRMKIKFLVENNFNLHIDDHELEKTLEEPFGTNIIMIHNKEKLLKLFSELKKQSLYQHNTQIQNK